jgi:palmitoyltransferase
MIVFLLAVTAYAVYVYIGHLCIAMVRQKPKAMGSRGQGSECPTVDPIILFFNARPVAYIIIFSFLFLMYIWTYMRVIITPPGFAADVSTHSCHILYRILRSSSSI